MRNDNQLNTREQAGKQYFITHKVTHTHYFAFKKTDFYNTSAVE